MKKYMLTALIAVSLFSRGGSLYAQKFDPVKLEASIRQAIQKAYPASVRIWGFDAIKKVQMSAQFSGVVVSAEGHILTAAHVNTPGNTYKVMFPDGTSYIARGLGEIELSDNRSVPDVAMLKVIGDYKGPYAEMGWSSSLKKDEPCISIAYPESLNQPLPTIRFGRITDPNNQLGFLRSTCIMEPGDSGGPLFDLFGRVIGLHSAIDVSEKDNFEVPVDLYRKYWTALNKGETYTAYPALEDPVGRDSLTAAIPSVPGLGNPGASFAGRAASIKGSSLLVKSHIKGAEQSVQATVMSLEGSSGYGKYRGGCLLISKSSLVGDEPLVGYKNKTIRASILARSKEDDLVLLYIEDAIKGAIKLKQLSSDTVLTQQPGNFLLSLFPGDSCKVSVLGGREIRLPKMSSSAYLGALAGMKQGWVTLTDVQAGSPASEGGLKQGDQVLSLNGVNVEAVEDLAGALNRYWPGDTVRIKVMRSDSLSIADLTLIKEVTLATQPPRHFNHPAEMFAGGKSVRRDGFAGVLVHDAILRPNDCGGPVFDLSGRFYGINIARYSRTSSLIMPTKRIFEFIEYSLSRIQ